MFLYIFVCIWGFFIYQFVFVFSVFFILFFLQKMVCLDVENLWGLVIIVLVFWIQFMVFGMVILFGVYIVEFFYYFDVSLVFIFFIGFINVGIFLGVGQWLMFLKFLFFLEIEVIFFVYMYCLNVKGGFICNFCLNLRVFWFKFFKSKFL